MKNDGKIVIEKLGKGWYNFEHVPQDSYIVVYNLNCGTDKQAFKQAKKLNPNFEYKIKDRI